MYQDEPIYPTLVWRDSTIEWLKTNPRAAELYGAEHDFSQYTSTELRAICDQVAPAPKVNPRGIKTYRVKLRCADGQLRARRVTIPE